MISVPAEVEKHWPTGKCLCPNIPPGLVLQGDTVLCLSILELHEAIFGSHQTLSS